jgi:2'-5' RNA ligase
VTEETGWSVGGTPQLAFVGDWWTDPSDPSSARREFDFLIDAQGDLDRPRLEWPKHTEFRWIGAAEVPLLDENRGRDDGLVRHLAEIALRSAAPDHLSHPHAGLFPGFGAAEPIEMLRRRWDPAMASQIAAHVTVAYPGEVNSLEELLERTRRAVSLVAPFQMRMGPVRRREGTRAWVGLAVIDRDDGWRRLRELIVPPVPRRSVVEPHVTIVHPRHSNLGSQAWEAVRTLDVAGEFAVAEVGISAFDGRVWRTVERFPLGPR